MFKIDIKQNGKYENKTPNFKAMDLGEVINITATEVLKEGTASKDGRNWTWVLFKFNINNQECAGFAPNSMIMQTFKDNIGKTLQLTKETYRDNNDNEKIGFSIIQPEKSTSFEFHTNDLKDEEGEYTDKEAIELLKQQQSFDNLNDYIKLWESFGSTKERATLVFNNRN